MWGSILSGLGGFGKAIGGGVAKVGKGIGSGIVKGGQKIGSEFKERIGEMREGGGSGAAPMTPGFNPGASMPKLGGRPWYANPANKVNKIADIGGSKSNLGVDRAEPPRLPMPALDLKPPMPLTQMQQSGHPPLTGFDTSRGVLEGTPQRNAPPLTGMNTDTGRLEASRLPSPPMPSAAPGMIRDSVQITDSVPGGQVQAPDVSVQGGIGEKRIDPLMIPAMPNRGRDPIPYNQYDDARYRYVMDHLKENKDGSAGFSRNWKSILQNGLIGAANYADSGDWGKMLGGALGGIGGATVNPQRGYEMAFDRGHGAHMMEAQGMRDQRSDAERKQRMGQLDEDYSRYRIDHMKNQDRIAEGNLSRQERIADSQIKLNEARQQAALRGTPARADLYNPATNQIETVNVYPDGRREVLGISGSAITAQQNREAQNYRDASNRESREYVAQLPARNRADGEGIPTEARQEYGRINRMKDDANDLWTRAKTEADPDKKAALEEQARAALENYNRNAKDFGSTYGEHYETGKGDGGWSYAKPRTGGGQGRQAAPMPAQTSVSRRAIEEYAKEKGVTVEEAANRFAAKGIQVR